MARPNPNHIVVIGAGAAGLMAARELAREGKRATIVEARDRCGGRIHPLPSADFGYPAEGGAEFVHGEAPVTHGLLREAGLSLLPIQGTQWTVEDGKFSREESRDPHEAELHMALQELKDDLTVGEFLRRRFAGPQYGRLRHSIERMVEGYDAADPGAGQHLGASRRMDGWRTESASPHNRRLWRPRRISDSGVPQLWRCDPSRLSRLRHRSEQRKGRDPLRQRRRS